jgi:uncharacterized Zn finger protein
MPKPILPAPFQIVDPCWPLWYYACPFCGEDDIDHLVWLDDEKVRCDSCGTIYDPNQPDEEA